eukprot:scaffold888_cov569-Prasinococcus_capsulatus_cf.AAC.29
MLVCYACYAAGSTYAGIVRGAVVGRWLRITQSRVASEVLTSTPARREPCGHAKLRDSISRFAYTGSHYKLRVFNPFGGSHEYTVARGQPFWRR